MVPVARFRADSGDSMTSLRISLAAVLFSMSCVAEAQTGSRVSEPQSTPPSRWQQEVDQLDQALRARALTAVDPRGLWMAGQLDPTDPEAQVKAFAQARVRVPAEKVFLSSLATACLVPMQPLPPECDATDRLADWATRDEDNGVPMLLLADRARQRNNATAVVAFLEEAALRPRFDDYWNRGSLFVWEEVRALPGPGNPAAKAELAATYGAARTSHAVRTMQALCRDSERYADGMRSACNAAGMAAAQRASTWTLRTAGARLAERSAGAGPAQVEARQLVVDVQRRAFECAEAGNPIADAFQSSDPAVRARAVAQWEARLVQNAELGEVAACARTWR